MEFQVNMMVNFFCLLMDRYRCTYLKVTTEGKIPSIVDILWTNQNNTNLFLISPDFQKVHTSMNELGNFTTLPNPLSINPSHKQVYLFL